MKKALLLMAAACMGAGAFAAADMPTAGKFYKVKHSSGNYLTRVEGGFKIEAEDAANDAQYFRFDNPTGDYYALRADNGLFISSDGKWSALVLSNPNYDYAQFEVACPQSADYVLLINKGMKAAKGESKACFGTDANDAGSYVYTDKDGKDGKHQWTLVAAPADYEAPTLAVGEDKYAQYSLPEDDPRANAYEGYKLVFAEEFNAPNGQPDKTIWNYEKGYKRNNEDQYYWDRPENTWFESGALVFNGRREPENTTKNPIFDPYAGTGHAAERYLTWTSASIQTKGSWNSDISEGTEKAGFTWLFGIYEVRAKVPAYTGCWPAIWSTGKQWSWPKGGEIDLMEWYGNCIHGNVCWYQNGEKWNSATVNINDLKKVDPQWGDHYHVWKMVWDYDHMEMWCDNILVNNIDLSTTYNSASEGQDWSEKNPFRQVRNFIWLNLALGGRSGGSLKNCPDDNYYLVDYARVYQKIGSDGAAEYHVDPWEPDATMTEPQNNPRYNGVASVFVDDENAPVEYYNLQGIRIANPAEGQMVIRRQGSKSQKMIF